MSDYLTIDIGASSGKILLGRLVDGKLESQCVHRFPNGYIRKNGHLVWDIDRLLDECISGIDKAMSMSDDIRSLAIDTWGCDFVLVDSNGNRTCDAVSYRDKRTDDVECPVSWQELYRRTGIQFLKFNTVYQLLALKKEGPAAFDKASRFMMIPDYLAYRLTGNIHQEYTNATTTSLVNAEKREWDIELIGRLGIPIHLFQPLEMPGTAYGTYRGIRVIAAPSHDTASAVLGCPLDDHTAFLSSGTWSLLGAVIGHPVLTEQAMAENFTNEGGAGGTIRFLRNLMGTWMLQRLRAELGNGISFDDLENSARREKGWDGIVDIEDPRFTDPVSMIEEVRNSFREKGRRAPETVGELSRCLYDSLAYGYADTLDRLEGILGKKFTRLAIVGGGSKDEYLCQLTADMTGIEVTAGPSEGTAIGNLLCQIVADGKTNDTGKLLRASERIRTYRRRVI